MAEWTPPQRIPEFVEQIRKYVDARSLHPEDRATCYREVGKMAQQRADEIERDNDQNGVPDR